MRSIGPCVIQNTGCTELCMVWYGMICCELLTTEFVLDSFYAMIFSKYILGL